MSRPTDAVSPPMKGVSAVTRGACDMIGAANLAVDTPGEGFVEITCDVAAFARAAGAGVLLLCSSSGAETGPDEQ